MQKILLILIFLIITVVAKDIFVTGYGNNELEAKKSALQELSNQIEVTLKSQMTITKSASKNQYKQDIISILNSVSTTKFLGLEWGYFDSYQKNIILKLPIKSHHLYIQRLKSILVELNYCQNAIKNLKTDVTKIKFYKTSQFLIKEYMLLKKVALYLNLKNIPKPKKDLKAMEIDILVNIDKLIINPSVQLISDLFKNILIKDELKIDLRFRDRIKDDILLYNGDEVTLVIKANKPIYYYIIETIKNKETGKIINSLLELNFKVRGNNKFIGYIGFDEIKKYIPLGKFDIKAPYGIEHLHIFASTKKFKTLPKIRFKNNLFIIKGKTQNIIFSSRGLLNKDRLNNNKKIKNEKVFIAESSLDFETRNF
jgi:hypothetical protein